MKRQRKSRGFNLIESAIVLGVVGLVIGGIWVAAASVIQNYRVNKTVGGLISSCLTAARIFPKTAARASGGSGINVTAAAVSAGVFPDDWLDKWTSSSTITAPIGSIYSYGVTLWDMDRGGASINGNIDFSLANLNESECRNLVSKTAAIVINMQEPPLTSVRVNRYSDRTLATWIGVNYYIDGNTNVLPSNVSCGQFNQISFVCRTNSN